MATLRRPLLISGSLHAVIVALIWSARAPSAPERVAAGAPGAVGFVLDRPPPSATVVEVVAPSNEGDAGSRHRVAAVAPDHRPRAPRALPISAVAATAPETAAAVPVPAAAPSDETPIVSATSAGEEARAVASTAAGADVGAPDGGGAGKAAAGPGEGGAGAGDGDGDGDGEGSGAGAGTKSTRGELHARVLGNVTIDLRAREGIPVVSHDEATALRERDAFPRLHERQWPAWQPYVVALEICVGGDGSVSDVVLRSSASARLDARVLAAAKTWRYRPRIIDGQPTPFCHGVVIKYERW